VQARRPLDGRLVEDPVAEVRRRCRDAFRRNDLLARLVPLIEEVLSAGGLPIPNRSAEVMPVAFEEPGGLGDAGHRG
jgi:CRISPR-associated protein Cas1